MSGWNGRNGQCGPAPAFAVELLVKGESAPIWGNALGGWPRFASLAALERALPDVARALRDGRLVGQQGERIDRAGDVTAVGARCVLRLPAEELRRAFPDLVGTAVEPIPDGAKARITVEVVPPVVRPPGAV